MVLFGQDRNSLVKSVCDGTESDQNEKTEMRNGLNFSILDLENNILYEILSRLPIRSIFACRCVCKRFFKFLRVDPYFAKLHLTRAPTTASLVLQRSALGQSSFAFYMFDLDQGFRSSTCSIDCHHSTCHSRNHLNPTILEQNPIFWCLNKFATIAGECNGLLCLYHNSPVPLYMICNPILGEYVSLPYPPLTTQSFLDSVCFRFGYSPKSGDYKVIHFARMMSIDALTSLPKTEIVVYVHTLGSDSWRIIHDAPCPRFQGSFDSLLNGSLHWITESHKLDELLCSLNLESECFVFLPPPSHFSMDNFKKISYTNLGVFRGSLCLCYVDENSQFEVWVMKDYGVKESWTKEFSIDINFYSGLRDVDFLEPLKFLNNGELWLRCSFNHLVSYNPQTRTFRDLDMLGEFPFEVILHYPSVTSLRHAVKGKNQDVVKVGRDNPAFIFLV